LNTDFAQGYQFWLGSEPSNSPAQGRNLRAGAFETSTAISRVWPNRPGRSSTRRKIAPNVYCWSSSYGERLDRDKKEPRFRDRGLWRSSRRRLATIDVRRQCLSVPLSRRRHCRPREGGFAAICDCRGNV